MVFSASNGQALSVTFVGRKAIELPNVLRRKLAMTMSGRLLGKVKVVLMAPVTIVAREVTKLTSAKKMHTKDLKVGSLMAKVMKLQMQESKMMKKRS